MSEASTTRPVVHRSRKRRFARWLLVTLAGSFLLVVVWNLVKRELTRVEGKRELAAAIVDADRDDPDWRWDRLNATRKKPPEGKNGAELIPQIKKRSHADWGKWQAKDEWKSRLDVTPNVRYSPSVVAQVRRELTDAADAVVLARTLKDYPFGHREIVLKPNVMDTLLEDTSHTRHAAELLRWDLVLALEETDTGRATDDLLAMLNVSRSIGDEPFLISQLIRIAARVMATRALEHAVAQAGLTEEQLARVQAAWAADADEPLLLQGLRGDRAAYDTLFRNLADGTLTPDALSGLRGSGVSFESYAWWLWRVRLHSERAYYVRWTTQAVEAARRPPHEQGPLLAALTLPEGSDMKLAPLFLPAAGKVAGAWHRSMAEARCAVVGTACERFRQQHKRWPDTLLELVPAFLPAVPLDPYDAEPLRYRKLDNGVVIHSNGVVPPSAVGTKAAPPAWLPDGIEIGFRLWNPDQRRQPSPPDAEEP